MEYGSRLRFALFAIGGILLLVLSIWGITSIAKRVIGGPTTTTKNAVKQVDLAEYVKPDTFVRLTVEGPVVASEKYESYEIDVSQDYRELKIFSGYTKTVASDIRFDNNNNSYESFMLSLKQARFVNKNKLYGPDETGYCATGNRYVYELYDQDQQKIHTWNTSCSNSIGSFAGLGTSVRSLFRAQIPDFNKLAQKISIQ